GAALQEDAAAARVDENLPSAAAGHGHPAVPDLGVAVFPADATDELHFARGVDHGNVAVGGSRSVGTGNILGAPVADLGVAVLTAAPENDVPGPVEGDGPGLGGVPIVPAVADLGIVAAARAPFSGDEEHVARSAEVDEDIPADGRVRGARAA